MKLKVYLIDDDRHYARLLSYRLDRDDRNEVTVFPSGNALLETLTEPPNLILLDMMMPGLSGIDTLRELRALFPDLPVLVVSANGIAGAAAEAVKLGAYDFITKGQDDLLRLEIVVKNIRERLELRADVKRLRNELEDLRGGRVQA